MIYYARQGFNRLWNRDFNYPISARDKVAYRQLAYGIPFIGAAIEARDRMEYWDDYLRNRGMTWDDIKYPFMLNTGVQELARSGMNFVSSNVGRLYRSSVKEQVSNAYDRGFRNGYRWHR